MMKDALTPQARHHFTRFDQVDRLCAVSEAAPDLAFMGRLLALCSLPRTNPGDDQLQYERINGPFTLIMYSSGKTKLPYGTLPRLLLVWMCTEAVRTQSPMLILGGSFLEFMHKLGITDNSGGKRSYRTRLSDQMDRLFGASIEWTYEDENVRQYAASRISDRGELWWNPRRPPDERGLAQSRIELGAKFFESILEHSIPLDMEIVRALKRSSLGLDLYQWLNYRIFLLSRPIRLTWSQLYRQFGVDPAKAGDRNTVNSFRTESMRELKKIKAAWPDLDYATPAGGLELRPSKPSIPSRLM